ncbi:hypothetical protein MUK42_05406 [Musa troglodytarum]|uniref:Uncharacterized protein n=1 Tax=Musa troglodytarum TaxID=320322 RepID=A0A9E7I790_9LILI|nr:hypothetical protein MUK42_05406 [Musa troglodytarum]
MGVSAWARPVLQRLLHACPSHRRSSDALLLPRQCEPNPIESSDVWGSHGRGGGGEVWAMAFRVRAVTAPCCLPPHDFLDMLK